MSWNPQYQQSFITGGLIDILLGSLGSLDKKTLMHSVNALSNLSCAQNFHQKCSEMYLK